MVNIQETRSVHSNVSTSYSAPMVSDPEQIFNSTGDLLFYSTFQIPPYMVLKPAIALQAILGSDDEGLTFNTKQRTTPDSDVPQTLSELLNHSHLCAIIWQIAQE